MGRYPALQIISLCYKLLGVIGAVGGTIIIIALKDEPVKLLGFQLGAVVPYFAIFIVWFICISAYAMGELLAVWMDTEFNTRAIRERRQQQPPQQRIENGPFGQNHRRMGLNAPALDEEPRRRR